jgi:hypothetical protein
MVDILDVLSGARRRSDAVIKMHDLRGASKATLLKTSTACERAADEIKQLRAELANFKHDPKCASCGWPKSNHPYRHPFVAVALGEDS